MTVDNRAPFLVGLAEDVIDHVECDGCKINAAMGLAAFGLLDEFLERTGNPDPRPPEVPFRPAHREASPPQLADTSVVHEFRLRVVPPDGLTEAQVRRLLEHLTADFGKAVVAREASLESIRRSSGGPPPDDAITFMRVQPPAGSPGTGGVT
jgi:hypothetical protein